MRNVVGVMSRGLITVLTLAVLLTQTRFQFFENDFASGHSPIYKSTRTALLNPAILVKTPDGRQEAAPHGLAGPGRTLYAASPRDTLLDRSSKKRNLLQSHSKTYKLCRVFL